MNTKPAILNNNTASNSPSGDGRGSVVIVLDIGGTKIKMGLVQQDKILCTTSIDSHSSNGLTDKLPAIASAVNIMLHQKNIQPDAIAGVGISMPGIVDSKEKKVLSIDNKFNDVVDMNLSEWVSNTWHTDLEMENDARCALIGEWQFGKGKGYNNIVLMTIGTGVGSSAVIEGNVLRGKHFQAGCLGGHFTVNINGEICNCGNKGCVEVEASTWNIERIAKQHAAYNSSSLSAQNKIDFESVFTHAANGDMLAKLLREQCLNVWSAAAVNLIHAYDPEILIIGGGVMASAEYIIPYIQQKVNTHAWTPWGKVKIEAAKNINAAALLGAAYLVFNH
ncbi:MAG TPA: ROK family protein [Parafilimonas sp.]|nr:ROK family protein [Parafilimonas sp.]